MKLCYLKFVGTQPGYKEQPSVSLYNVVKTSEPCHKLPVGATVTLETVRAQGFTVINSNLLPK